MGCMLRSKEAQQGGKVLGKEGRGCFHRSSLPGRSHFDTTRIRPAAVPSVRQPRAAGSRLHWLSSPSLGQNYRHSVQLQQPDRMAGRPSQAQDLFDNPASRLRYEAYSRLQAAAVAFGENLPIPEIVAIGGQSDGKSSLLEAFLGVSAKCRHKRG